MKIAILFPLFQKNTTQQNDDSLSGSAASLAQGLASRGIEVSLFAAGNPKNTSVEIWRSLTIAEVFERTGEFDVIHNFLGPLPLTYTTMTRTPVVATIPAPVPPDLFPVYKKYNETAFYVAVSESDKTPELDYFATIPQGDQDRMAQDYITAYEQIIQKTTGESHRPWGFYEILSETADHKVKRITVLPGQRLSYQRHLRRSEHWYIISGKALVTKDNKDINLTSGQTIEIPVKTWHRIQNPGPENMVFIEIQTGEYFGEDDIERSEDDYGRV